MEHQVFLNTEITERTEEEGRRAGQKTFECKVALVMGRDPLIGRREFAELGDGGWDDVQGEINVRRSGVAAKAKAEAGASFFRGQADRGENV
jgi:hypothetical protein